MVSLLQPLAARWRVSASVLLALVGIALGTLATLVLKVAPPIGSEDFLYIFLPLLLFQTALGIEVHRMFEDAAPILLLAVVAVLVATGAIGLALAPVAGVPLVACLMLGAIVATTDPVAVIDIFRDVGAPSRLRRLVEGESLLNDAAAITLFTIFVDILLGHQGAGVAEAMVEFCWEFFGGVAVGFLGARLIVILLSWLLDYRLAQVTLTVALPYLVFIIGDQGLHVSGVVAAVTAGLVMSAVAQPRVSPDDWKFLHEFWEQLAFWASSLIFILASLLVPRLVRNVTWMDAVSLLVLVLAALVARAIVVFGFIPALSSLKLSQRVDNRFKTVILWGGLRGAVTLALALAVTENPEIPKDVQRFIAVLATGFVLFTLLINGTTLSLLIKLLKLDRLSPFDQALRAQVLELSHERVVTAVKTVGKQYRFSEDVIAGVAGAQDTQVMKRPDTARLAKPGAGKNAEDDRLKLGLVAISARERELILEHFASRTVSGRIVEELMTDVGRLLERTRAKGQPEYLAAGQAMVGFDRRFRWAQFLHRRFHMDRPLVDALSDRFERLLVSRIALEELMPYIDDKLDEIVGARLTPIIQDAVRQRQQMTAAALDALTAQYPAYAELLERRFLHRVALRREHVEHQTLFEDQVIGPELYSVLRRELEVARAKVDARPRLDLGLETRALIKQVPMFSSLNAKQLDMVARLLRPHLAVPGEVVIRAGDEGDSMYFISSGSVEVAAANQKIALGRGDFFGEMALLLHQRRQADVVAKSYCQMLVLKDEDFGALLKGNREIRARIDQVAAERSKMNLEADKNT